MRLAVAGASGFLGSALVPVLRADGHQVLRLVRREPRDPDEVRWDPGTGRLDLDALTGLDGAINLAGAPIGARRWTPEYKQVIRDSRVDTTAALATALAGLDPAPRVLLAGSAAGYYGDTGTVPVDESAPAGVTFLAGVARDTEAATAPAVAAGVRVAFLRTGIVLHPGGGSLARVFPLLRLGLGGSLGSGRQYWSWISLPDELRAIRFLLTADGLAGPVNLTAPHPVPNREVIAAFGRALHRPTVLRVPAGVLRATLGELAGEALQSQRVLPRRLLDAGFTFDHSDIASAARTVAA